MDEPTSPNMSQAYDKRQQVKTQAERDQEALMKAVATGRKAREESGVDGRLRVLEAFAHQFNTMQGQDGVKVVGNKIVLENPTGAANLNGLALLPLEVCVNGSAGFIRYLGTPAVESAT